MAINLLQAGKRKLNFKQGLRAGCFGTGLKAWCQASTKDFDVKRANDVSRCSVCMIHLRI